MINLTFNGMCKGCKCADLQLEEMQVVTCEGIRTEWDVRCIHYAACDAMESRMVEKYAIER